MRWDELFSEIEAQEADRALIERDAQVDELERGAWSERSWLDIPLGCAVSLTLYGDLRVQGVLAARGRDWLAVNEGSRDAVVATATVIDVSAEQVSDGEADALSARIGWGYVLRQLAAEGSVVSVFRSGGPVVQGHITAVGQDFVQLAGSGRTITIPWHALVCVKAQH